MSRYEYPNNSYYAYNETFVDDEGLEVYQNELRASQYLHEDDDDESANEQSYQTQTDNQRFYQSIDQYDDRLDYLNLSMRQPPIGEGTTYRRAESTNVLSVDKKKQQYSEQQPPPIPQQPKHRYEVINQRRQRSSSVPSRRRIVTNEPNVLAPMMKQAGRQLRRSQSTIISQRNRQNEQAREFQRQAQICSTPRIQRQTATPVRLKSYTHFMSPAETNLSQKGSTMIGQRNTAIISPNYRQQENHSALPLLANSPVKLQFMNTSPNKTNSWNISNHRVPTEPLWFAGLILLFTGGASCLLCLFILSKEGRKYYLDFGAISGFICLILGMVGCKTSRWLPHRHYVTGYILLSAFSLLQCGVLAILASDSKQLDNNIVDIAGGAVCGLSVLLIILATLGFLTSACCNLPPPDSRVSHSVQGFNV